MKRLELEADPNSSDLSDERYMTVQNLFKIENAINSHSEAIKKLEYQIGENAALWEMGLNAISRMQDKVYREPTDDKPKSTDDWSKYDLLTEARAKMSESLLRRWEPNDTHRTETDDKPVDKSESIAKAFHDTYERLAPSFGYSTRKSSAVPWEEVPDNNKALMIATVREVMNSSLPEPDDTHRTVTLRIPKDMTVGEAIAEAILEETVYHHATIWLEEVPDTDLQAAIDKIGGSEQ